MFLGEQASSVRQPGREGSDHGDLQGRLEGDDSGGDGETLRLQGDLGTGSINSGEHLAWKNKVDKGRTGLSLCLAPPRSCGDVLGMKREMKAVLSREDSWCLSSVISLQRQWYYQDK